VERSDIALNASKNTLFPLSIATRLSLLFLMHRVHVLTHLFTHLSYRATVSLPPAMSGNVIFSPTAIPNGSFSLLLLLPGLAKFFPIPVPVPLATPIPSRCHCQSHTTETKRFLARAYVTARYYCLSVCPSHS